MAASLSALSLRNVGFSYGGARILERISMEIPHGQFVTLLGASGSGKSTLLRLLAGLAEPGEGELRWQDRPINGPGLDRGVVFQDYSLFTWMSLIDNVALAVAKFKPASSRVQRRDEAVDYLRKVGLEAALHKYPFELSGGMQQRAAIARALALGSPLLLMDEPFGALDPVNRARLQDLVLDIWETSLPKKTIVFVTHDVDEALYLGDRVVILGAAPARVIADLPVNFPRRRDRQNLYENESFHALRERIAEALNADTLQLLEAA